ncbi:MAG: response regulator, partial [Panacibacter sp.]
TFISILPVAENILSGKKVLIAEDNYINQKILVNLLKKWDMNIKIANNGKEAIQALQKDSNFHFILMDLQMPEMDGFQTAAFIRNRLSLNIPIIAMTASVMRGEKEKCLSVGINEFITKPFSSAKLTDILQCLLVDNEDSKKNEENIILLHKANSNTGYSLRYLYEVGDDEYCSGVLEMFLKDTPAMLKAIREAAFCQQWDEVHKKVHKLKSSLGVMQMQQILDLMNQVESKALERYGLVTITADIDKAVELFRITQPMIEADLNNIKQATA